MGSSGDAAALMAFVRDLQIFAGLVHREDVQEARAAILRAVDNLPQELGVLARRTAHALTLEAVCRFAAECHDIDCELCDAAQLLGACSTAELNRVVRRCVSGACSSSSPRLDLRVQRALAYIEAHASDPRLDLNGVASAVRLSRWHLSRLITRHTGTSFRDLRRRLRMRSAVPLLQDVALSIKEVSARLGYTYPAEFNRDFKTVFGVSPTRWRMKHLRRGPVDRTN